MTQVNSPTESFNPTEILVQVNKIKASMEFYAVMMIVWQKHRITGGNRD
uniref:Uncharacterized protein n=1 Tax=Nelumbo nucifera TaxID=4432 RepID=A0A822Y4A3_NELNU|nr:TPA_asm: hypothetical protein HUJ06_025922 [Nelumbo nucifera]